MLTLLKRIAGPLISYAQDPTYRRFIHFLGKARLTARYESRNIKLCGKPFRVVDMLSFAYQYEEIFCQENYLFPATRIPHIIDCGANVGTSVLYFAKQYPGAHINAFEADPKVFSVLQENVAAQGLQNVCVVQKAIWVDDQGILFHQEGADGGAITQSASSAKTVSIPSIRLKTFLEEYKHSIDLLKIDIEGAEVTVLRDAQSVLHKVDALFVEYHSFHDEQQELGALLSLLSEEGFRYYTSTINTRVKPLFPPKRDMPMDLQVNVFAYRV